MPKRYPEIDYQPMPYRARFGVFGSLVYQESCYTDQELRLRLQILKARAASGIDPELLKTDNCWFSEASDHALTNTNANAWILADAYQPIHIINRNDFHIGLFNSQRVNWEGLSTLGRVIGDYLLLRNAALPDQHLNQPMNYLLLDLVRMLKTLAGENAGYTLEQLKFTGIYLRQVESLLQSETGSDRLFLAETRRTIEMTLIRDIENKLASQRFKSHTEQVQRRLRHIAELRHAVLHFVLTENEVNSHPFLEYFENPDKHPASSTKFPTLAAKACVIPKDHKQLADSSQSPPEQYQLILKQLNDCPDFKLIANLPDNIEQIYTQGLTDLQEMIRFNSILDQLSVLLDQAGEVITLIQFREQILTLLQQMERFIQRSHTGIIELIEVNEHRYFQFIQAKQNLHWWEKISGAKQKVIDTFIANQDNLARFKATEADLRQANIEFLQESSLVTNHLQQQASLASQENLVTSARDQIDALMDSIHLWINQRYQSEGLAIEAHPTFWLDQDLIAEEPQVPNQHGFFFAPQNQSVPENTIAAEPSAYITAGALVALIILSSITLYWLVSFFNWHNEEEPELDVDDDMNTFKQVARVLSIRIDRAQKKAIKKEDTILSDILDDFAEDLEKITEKSPASITALNRLKHDLDYCLEEMNVSLKPS